MENVSIVPTIVLLNSKINENERAIRKELKKIEMYKSIGEDESTTKYNQRLINFLEQENKSYFASIIILNKLSHGN